MSCCRPRFRLQRLPVPTPVLSAGIQGLLYRARRRPTDFVSKRTRALRAPHARPMVDNYISLLTQNPGSPERPHRPEVDRRLPSTPPDCFPGQCPQPPQDWRCVMDRPRDIPPCDSRVVESGICGAACTLVWGDAPGEVPVGRRWWGPVGFLCAPFTLLAGIELLIHAVDHGPVSRRHWCSVVADVSISRCG